MINKCQLGYWTIKLTIHSDMSSTLRPSGPAREVVSWIKTLASWEQPQVGRTFIRVTLLTRSATSYRVGTSSRRLLGENIGLTNLRCRL